MQEGRHARRDADPEVLARGRRPLHHAAAGLHEGSRNRHAQHRHLPHAGVRRPHDRHALAAAQGRRAALPRRRAAEASGCRSSVALGADPALPYSATAPMPEGLDELLLAGFLRRERVELVKCVTIDLEVPANAQIVLEGYVEPGERRREGPFGDHTGFYSHPDDYPVFHLTCITRRKNPIYLTTVVGIPPMEDYYLGKASERIFLPLIRKTVPEIVDMHFPAEGIFHNIVLISIDKRYPGHARKIMNAVLGPRPADVLEDGHRRRQGRRRAEPVGGRVDRRHAQRSRARHPVHARAGGRPRGRQRPAGLRQQDGHRRHAQVAVRRVQRGRGRSGSATTDAAAKRADRGLGRGSARGGRHERRSSLDEAQRACSPSAISSPSARAATRSAAAVTARGRRSCACSRSTSTRPRRRCRPAASAGEIRIAGTPASVDAAIAVGQGGAGARRQPCR